MFKDVMGQANLMHWAEAGLVIFFTVFVGACIWALTRPRKVIEQWESLPLRSGEPGERFHE